MFCVQEIEQDDDQKPPSFFNLLQKEQIIGSAKIMQAKALLSSLTHQKQNQIQGLIILYEEYIVARVQEKNYLVEIDLTITFEACSEGKQIKFKDCQRQLEIKVIFSSQDDFQRFYGQIKRFLFQTNFQEKYEILGKVGSGKTSLVFEIKNKISGLVYAAKFYSNIPSSIQKQIEILRCLEHPNLIYFQEFFLSKGQVYIVMDYEDGGNLLDKIQQSTFPSMKQKIKFLMDMLNAFEFLRIKGIIHRDLKPQNILYSKKENCYKIADFQLAVYQNEPVTKLVGTPGYIAPERFDVEKQILHSQYSDIYTLGLIYYQFATKKTYYHGQSIEAMLYNNRKSKSLKKIKFSKQHISELQYDILRMMIRTEPEKRSLSLEIMQSSEFRKLVNEFSIAKKGSISSSTSSNKKTKSRKDSLNEDFQENIQEENFVQAVKKIFRIKSSI